MQTFNIFPLAVVDGISDPHMQTTAAQLKLVGGNYGNLAFRHGVACNVDATLQPWHLASDRGRPLVVTAANWIDRKSAPISEELLQAIRQSSRAVVFGLGAQAPLGSCAAEFAAQIDPEVVQRIRALCDLVAVVGVRDDYTRDLLASLGVFNVDVLGCLSNFISPEPALGLRMHERCSSNWSPARIAITEHTVNLKDREQARRTLLRTMELVESLDATYVLQGRHLIAQLRRESAELNPTVAELLDPMAQTRLSNVVGRRARYFTRVPEWLDFYRSRDLVIGSRVHGAVLACQAGVPSVLVVHDSRTAGLASTMALPTIDEAAFLSWDGDPRAMLQVVERGYEAYDDRRRELARRWVHFFGKQGFPVKGAVRFLANSDGTITTDTNPGSASQSKDP